MKNFYHKLSPPPFYLILVISFSMVAVLTIALGALGISLVVRDYLTKAMNERVERDMHLAESIYSLTLKEIEGVTARVANNPEVIDNLQLAINGDTDAKTRIANQIRNNLPGLTFGGNFSILMIEPNGELIVGCRLPIHGNTCQIKQSTNWNELPIFNQILTTGQSLSATELLPEYLLAQVDLAEQAHITILDTPKAASSLFNLEEGHAGLALVSATPVINPSGNAIAVVLAFHMFNNDFNLVDRIKEAADIDTATIFLGDLRVSTNVMTAEGNRAIGTRLSENVAQVVLINNEKYIGTAFVVNENYITQYDPLFNHKGDVVGILYVGAKQASFYRLVNTFNQQIVLFAIGMILLTILITTPVSRAITRPLNQLKDLIDANRQVADGDFSVRVPVSSPGEVGQLALSFNSMLNALQTTQDQLVQSEKLASLGQLAAGIAHELNNPLGTILLYADIMLKEQGDQDFHTDDIEIILRETKRCKNIVSALLEFARQNQVITQPTDINELINNIIQLSKQHYQNLPIEFIHTLDPDLPQIQADANQLQQVLENLINNAVDAMPEGGQVLIRTYNKPAGSVTIEVEDTGIGIPPENINKIFTPFFTTKRIGEGTGLGLAIVYGIIKMHRGQINLSSKLRKGTTFTITLPVKLPSTPNLIQSPNKLDE
jgi:two-component system NtrC family sensor kinase